MAEPTLKDRIVDGLRESQASEIRELEEQIEQTTDKLRRMTSKRDQLIRDSEQRLAELAAVQQAPDEEQEPERFDGMS